MKQKIILTDDAIGSVNLRIVSFKIEMNAHRILVVRWDVGQDTL
jgi:hypothetical protein